jgi:hypothetical protein
MEDVVLHPPAISRFLERPALFSILIVSHLPENYPELN